jgi:hypothetical protein
MYADTLIRKNCTGVTRSNGETVRSLYAMGLLEQIGVSFIASR